MRTLRDIIAPFFLSACLFFPVKTFSEKEIVFNETYSIPMIYEYGEKNRRKNQY
jgi:hypothetical protein